MSIIWSLKADCNTLLILYFYFVVVYQHYEPEVQNPGGFIGSNVLIKCNIPSFVKEYVTVTSWLQEPNFNIYPSLEGGNCIQKDNYNAYLSHLFKNIILNLILLQ